MKKSEAEMRLFDKVYGLMEQKDDRTFDLERGFEKKLIAFLVDELGMLPPQDKSMNDYDHCDCGYINTDSITWDKE